MNRYEIFDITAVEDPVLEKIKSLYYQSFPENERRPWESIISMIENSSPFFRLMAFVGNDGVFIGFMTIWSLPAAKYIEHFAIEPSKRSDGYGSDVLTDVVSSADDLPVVVEVELPEASAEAVRRISFYERNGFHAMDQFPYFQPPYRPDLDIVPMMLMTTKELADPEMFVIMLHTLVYNQ